MVNVIANNDLVHVFRRTADIIAHNNDYYILLGKANNKAPFEDSSNCTNTEVSSEEDGVLLQRVHKIEDLGPEIPEIPTPVTYAVTSNPFYVPCSVFFSADESNRPIYTYIGQLPASVCLKDARSQNIMDIARIIHNYEVWFENLKNSLLEIGVMYRNHATNEILKLWGVSTYDGVDVVILQEVLSYPNLLGNSDAEEKYGAFQVIPLLTFTSTVYLEHAQSNFLYTRIDV